MGVLLAGAFISGIIGLIIGGTKGKGGAGFLLGLFLGPIGWLISAVDKPTVEVAVRREAELNAARAAYAAQQQGQQASASMNPWDQRR